MGPQAGGFYQRTDSIPTGPAGLKHQTTGSGFFVLPRVGQLCWCEATTIEFCLGEMLLVNLRFLHLHVYICPAVGRYLF